MPLFAFGMQNSLVKFFSQCKTEQEESRFLSFAVLLPLLSIPLLLIGLYFFDDISIYLSQKNNSEGLYLIPSLDCAWLISKYSMLGPESMHSVFGNFVKVALRSLSL
jgi:hypothetical protein